MNGMNQPLVSIIVPVYNIAAYVEVCIKSLVAQTYPNIEIILVDDGSTDDSGPLCDQATINGIVRVIHKTNGGLSDARNTGIRASRGDYLAFVDGDDYVHPDFVNTLMEALLENDADISVANHFVKYTNETRLFDPNTSYLNVLSNVQAMRELFLIGKSCSVYAWNKIYKKQLFLNNHIEFPVGKIHEDTFTTYRLFLQATRIVTTGKPLYYYVQRGSSIMGTGYTPKNMLIVDAADDMERYIRDQQIPLRTEAQSFRLTMTLYVMSRMSSSKEATMQDWRKLANWIMANKLQLLFFNRYVTNTQKAVICVVALGWRPYLMLRWLLRLVKIDKPLHPIAA
jgi:glycosyltransferase involved in cell wall biosynthesis